MEFPEVEDVMVMRLQRHHVHPTEPRQGSEDPHVPHRLTFFVNFILQKIKVVKCCRRFPVTPWHLVYTCDCFLLLAHVRIAENRRTMKIALRMRTRVMLEDEAYPGYLRSS